MPGKPGKRQTPEDWRIDRGVGARVRQLRTERGMAQEALAARIGLTFQQVQKYENASNRISASKLAAIAQALEVPIAALFEGTVDALAITEDPHARLRLELGKVIATASPDQLLLLRDLVDVAQRRAPLLTAAE